MFMKNIKILILDDHQIILDGLRTMLSNDKHIIICGTYLSGIDAIKNALIHQPNVIITDLMMPDMSGLDFIKNLKSYNIKAKILILSMCMSSNIIQDAIQAGANGFILKQNATHDEILKAITHVTEGMDYFTSELLTTISSKPKQKNGSQEVSYDNLDISVLSKNEVQVLQLFADGFSNKEISQKLSMTIKTIEKHKSNMMAKLNLKSNIDLIKFAIKNNVCYL
jgi:two-component system, NarL family, nitrate/nitrite response regulator NarL